MKSIPDQKGLLCSGVRSRIAVTGQLWSFEVKTITVARSSPTEWKVSAFVESLGGLGPGPGRKTIEREEPAAAGR